MAKIRGIKPETWTDDKFVQLTPLARLLFIGLWNLSCDNGHVEDSPVQMKMRVLPMDSCDVRELVDEMVGLGLVERSQGWLKVVNLVEHQKKPDRRFLTLCEHCAHDEQAAYVDADKLPRTASKPGPQTTFTTVTQRAHGEHTASAQRVHAGEGEGEGDGEGDGEVKARTASRKRPAKHIPEDWQPTAKHRERESDGIDVTLEAKKFRLHAEANDRRQVNWNAAFSQWLLNARPSPRLANQQPAHRPHASEIEQPPDGLTEDEYAAWIHQQAAKR